MEMKMKQLILLSMLSLLPMTSYAQDVLPFTGTRYFQFTDGVCNGYRIIIKKSGATEIVTGGCSMQNGKTTKLYVGRFKSKVRIPNTNWGIDSKYLILEISNKTASLIDKNGEVLYSEGCSSSGDTRAACLSPLFK